MDMKDIITIFVSLTGASGLLGLLIGLFNRYSEKKRHQLEALKEYYKENESEIIVKIKREIGQNWREGKKPPHYDFEKNGHWGKLIEFFDKWGALCLKGYLPFFVFKGGSGCYVVSIYKYLFDWYIAHRRSDSNEYIRSPKYAYFFEQLVRKIEKYMQKEKREVKSKIS